jgi:hypothetical protein
MVSVFEMQLHIPFPDTVTAGSDARLLGGCSTVVVGLADVRLLSAAATARKVNDVFILPKRID